VPALSQALKDEDWEVRENAAEALGNIKDRRAVPALIEALNDEHSGARYLAERALVLIGKPAVPALKEAMEPRGLFERLGFDPTGRRERLRDVIQSIDESES
jgi:HEAT repeat protein